MAARTTRSNQEIPAEARAFGEDRSKWGYVPSGMPVYAVIGYLGAYDGDDDRFLREAGDALNQADLDFARQYYDTHREEIDRKLDQIANAEV
ncbi:MAG: hypothetical protein ACYDCQ_15160 [Dehalococcoidia bacterium]